MTPTNVRTAALVLRLPLGPDSQRRRRALDAVLRAACSGTPVAMRAVTRELESGDREKVWRTWLERRVSRESPQRWTFPLLPSASPPDILVDAAWDDWLKAHDPALWSLLERWNRPATDAEPRTRALSRLALGDQDVELEAYALVEAASRFDHPVGEPARARLATGGDVEAADLFCALSADSPAASAFCVAHGLAPSDDVQRAAFFVRTGQHEQYQASDPEGTLLALAYESASPYERGTLRMAMTELGGVDLLRIVAGRRTGPGGFAELTASERAYLAGRLKDRGDWERLWSLTMLLPLPEAVDNVRAFGDWLPSDEDDRRVFQALRTADPTAVRTCVETLSAGDLPALHAHLKLSGRLAGTTVVDGLDFAPDGSQLAFTAKLRDSSCAGVVDLRDTTLTYLHSDFPYPLEFVAHLGSDAIVVAASCEYDFDGSGRKARLHHADRDGVRTLGDCNKIWGLNRVAGNRSFIVSAWDGEADHAKWGAVLTGTSQTPLVRTGITDGIDYFLPLSTALDPDRRRVAVSDHGTILVAELDGSAVNRIDLDPAGLSRESWLIALSPSVLICFGVLGELRVWREPLTSGGPPVSTPLWSDESTPINVMWSPALDRFLVVHRSFVELLDIPRAEGAPLVSGRIRLDVPRSESRFKPPSGGDYVLAAPRFVRLSPKGDVLALGGVGDTIDLYAITWFTLRGPGKIAAPLGLMDREFMGDVGAALANPVFDGTYRPTLELLWQCLEYRFRHDIGIGEAEGAVAVADDDIGLGG
ncbi:hypothetical protein [Actinomadura sp. 9N215]|uniref:hypothetical protein n=1 Tax=Actinomadura sp. 9N215 TaxID=3375150 RepID=UPI0037B4F565